MDVGGQHGHRTSGARTRASPTPISVTMHRMKPYVGIAKKVPASFTPRRFASVTSITNITDSSTRYGESDGIAEMIATTPATVETTTVIM